MSPIGRSVGRSVSSTSNKADERTAACSLRASGSREARGTRVVAVSSTVLASILLAACEGPPVIINPGENPVSLAPTPKPTPTPTPTSTPTPTPVPMNAAPIADAGIAPSPTLPVDTVTFNGTATDDGLPAGGTLNYTWEYVSGPVGPGNSPGAIMGTPNSASPSVRFTGGYGDYVFNFKASDGELTGTSQLHVTVKPALIPGPIGSGNPGWETTTPTDANMDVTKLAAAKNFSLASGVTGNEAGYIIRGGKLVYSWGNPATRYEMKSTTKSMGGLALLLALDEARISLSDNVSLRIPSVFGTDPYIDTSAVTVGGLSDITVLQLATHTAGLSKPDNSTRALLYTPGTTWWYSDQGLNWLADVLTQTYAQDLHTLLATRVNNTLGIRTGIDLTWRNNAFRSDMLNVNGIPVKRREFASGINANVNAMARVGQLMLRKGVWGTQRILSEAVVAMAHTQRSEIATAALPDVANFPGATTNYGVLWWTNATGQIAGVPTDAYWAWGLHDILIIVVPSRDLVIARAGDHAWHPTDSEEWNGDYQRLEPFIRPIVEAAQ